MTTTMSNVKTSGTTVPVVPVAEPEAESAPVSQVLANDLLELQQQEQIVRNRQREQELARQRDVARFD